MIPSDPHREVVDPRRLVRDHGREALAELVARESGYIFQLRPLKDLCQSLKSGMPLLAEGERGGGKTEMVDALAYSCNRPYFELQGMDGLRLKDILFEWDEQGQNNFVVQAVGSDPSTLAGARREQWHREFLNLGEILKAYDHLATTGVVPIVKLDEFEKLPQVCQAFFYQLFTDGHASIPTRHCGSSPKNSNTFARLTRLRITTAPATSTPCTWNTDFAISRPIVLTSPMDGSPHVVCSNATTLWHFDAAEWAPSTASIATKLGCRHDVRFSPDSDH